MIEKREFSVASSDGIHRLFGVVYLPRGEARGLFHVVHGMTEHMARYDRFLADMAEAGFIAFGYDHIGHGRTAKDDSELGYIAKKRGWELLARDVAVYEDAVRREFGARDLPLYLMGHSMGSFVVRLAATRFVKPEKLIVMGTAGANPAAGAGLALIGLTKCLRGDRHISRLIDSIAFGSYNKRVEHPRTEFDWLTRETKIVDDHGNECEGDEVGELIVRGPGVMLCYYKNPEATAEVLRDGWLFTGDMAQEDEDGFIFLVDRKKDVIISGGENLYPVQIEDFIRTNDKVHDVAVIGLPDKRLGEIAAAIIEVKGGENMTEEEVNDFCLKLPRYKRPHKVIFADIPRNPTGKIEKPKLREMYGAEKLIAEQNLG